MKTKLGLLGVALLAGGTLFAQPRISVGIGVGGYGPGVYPPPAYAQQYAPPCPGPDYTWVDGYWGPRNVWVSGFWRAPAYPRYVAPRYSNSYRGYDRNDFRGYDRSDFRGHDRNDFRGHDRDDHRDHRR
uniref:Putative signal peptide protein n=1 Tax=Solibacter usitatus (strain Ellin6076) TaxID=234267 RepID=Q01W66_SOLUE